MDKSLYREGLIVLWVCYCALFDYRYRRLPNTLTFGGIGFALLYLFIQGSSFLGATPFSAIASGVGVLFIMAPMLWIKWLGAGDIKMLSAIGFLGGANFLVMTFVFSTLLTLPVIMFLWLHAFLQKKMSAFRCIKLPQGVFFALGAILSLFDSGVNNVS